MADLLSAAGNGTGTGASHTGACTILLEADSVMDGATVDVEIADSDVAGKYRSLKLEQTLASQGTAYCGATGTYYLRAVVRGGGSSTSINLVTTQ